MRITNGILLTMEGQNYDNGYIDFENGIITAVGDAKDAPAYDGEILDAQGGYILPSLIDAHSHIGISEEGKRWEGVDCCLTTDHDVEALWFLPYFASLAVREGLDEESALRSITINSARAAGVENRVGSLKPGKDADIVVFSGHPFHYLTKTTAVFINGKQEV